MRTPRLGSPDVRRYKDRIRRLDGLTCYFCKNAFPFEELTLEHLIPVARGGALRSKDNHALACGDCNNVKKSGLTVEEFCRVYELDLKDFPRLGCLKEGVYEIGPITNHADLARLALIG